MTTTTDDLMLLAWMAGVFEGEGSIRISRPAPRNMGSLCVDLPNTDRTLIEPFQAMWGGSIKRYAQKPPQREYYRWRCSSRQAEEFLLSMWPLLGTEKYRGRCVVALDFQAQKRSGSDNRSPDYAERQWTYYEAMKALNVRGISATCPQAAQHRRRP